MEKPFQILEKIIPHSGKKGEKYMGILQSVVKMFRGDIDVQTQHVTWNDTTAEYTSAFMASVVLFIAREFSKLTINHRIYRKQPDGSYLTSDKLGSAEFEVLNYNPNGMRTNSEWKREIIKRLMAGGNVYLRPVRRNGVLVSLEFTDIATYEKKPDDILVITSPIYSSKNASLYDRILNNIAVQLDSNKLRGFLKINAAISSNNTNFKDTALNQLKAMQEVASYNGLGVLDGKSELVELKNDYSTIPPETVAIIKREILNGFGFSESLLTGEYTEDDYRHFFDNVLAPIVNEFQTELTYKLLTTYARINTGDKQSFERIAVSVDAFHFAGVSQLIKLAAANTNGAYLTVNEVRKLMGFDPVEGGDVFRTNLNSTEISYTDNDGGDE